jgi:hypothetical protein
VIGLVPSWVVKAAEVEEVFVVGQQDDARQVEVVQVNGV